jgi:hypothetical protein
MSIIEMAELTSASSGLPIASSPAGACDTQTPHAHGPSPESSGQTLSSTSTDRAAKTDKEPASGTKFVFATNEDRKRVWETRLCISKGANLDDVFHIRNMEELDWFYDQHDVSVRPLLYLSN